MEKTLVILKPSAVLRGLIGEVIRRFEQKGLVLVGSKMMQLDNEVLDVHYAHLKERSFFNQLKESMMASPVIVQCWQGVDSVKVVRSLIGTTNGREAQPGTVRGDFAVSAQENIVHASDSAESAKIELQRFFTENEIFKYKPIIFANLYGNDEI